MAQNFASKYAKGAGERFYRESQAAMAVSKDGYGFNGVKSVTVYSIPTAPMQDYTRTGVNRYGTVTELGTTIKTYPIGRDRSFTFVIDKGDKIQSQMVLDAGKALARQIREVYVPEYDTYVFGTLAKAAYDKGQTDSAAVTKANAYEKLLNARESFGNAKVPDKGLVCFTSYRYYNLLKQDSSFVRYGDASQEMLHNGVVGEVDGVRLVRVPATRLPTGADFLLVYPQSAIAPQQLQDYKIHDDPPGVSGWLVEGRFIYDCFVLDHKSEGIWYQGAAITGGDDGKDDDGEDEGGQLGGGG